MTTADFSSGRNQGASKRGAERTQSGLLVAQEHLYTALRRPQPRRERAWGEMVSAALAAALAALREHRLEVEAPNGLYEDILRDSPWAEAPIRQIKAQLSRMEAEAVDLQFEVARVAGGDNQGLHAIRTEAERLLLTLRDILNKESDLAYERFGATETKGAD